MLWRLSGFLASLSASILVASSSAHAADLTLEQRIEAQEAIERVYHSHLLGTKTAFEQAVPRSAIESKVRRYMKLSAGLETPVTADALRLELERIAARTRFPERLREIYDALGRDPHLILECFVRPVLVERGDETPHLPTGFESGCLPDDTWTGGTYDELEVRSGHSAVWTGSLMLIWGGQENTGLVATGWRYDPLADSWTAMTETNAPTARSRHGAIWTGTEMLVWGGWDGTYSGTGGRYDPVGNSWTTMSNGDAPAARENHTAVWTGDEMVVWGGRNGPMLQSGGRYDPAGDSWTATSLTDAPAARQGHSAVWSGKRVIVWGGSDGAVMDTGGEYNPDHDRWEPVSTSGAPEARQAHTAVWTDDRMVAWGGYDSTWTALESGGLYNPNNGQWTATSTDNAPEARTAHSAVWADGLMLVWGGVGFDGYLDTGGRYDPVDDVWNPTSTEGAPIRRFGQTAVWSGSRMIVWGGKIHALLNSGGLYDPISDSWTPTAPAAPESRSGHSALWTGTHMVVWGGSSTNLGMQNTGGKYDPLIDLWTPTSTTGAPGPRSGHTAVWTGSRMLVWGGTEEQGGNVGTGGHYNPWTDSWAPISTVDAPSSRHFQTAIWTGSQMIVWGGFPDLDSGGRYDPATDTWLPTATTGAPTGRYWHTAVWTGSRMVIWAGYREPTFFNSGAQYDPADDSWSPTSTSGAPEGRFLHSAVWAGDEMIVWGGNNLSFSGTGTRFITGGLYDPVADGWSATSTVNVPVGRDHFSASWTGREMVVWGGQTGPPFAEFDIASGARYDPRLDEWVATSMTDAPSARRFHTAVWTGSDMMVWGGLAGPPAGPDKFPTTWGSYSLGHAIDDDQDGFSECDGDCDDTHPGIYPGAPEQCDNRDNDCDGSLPPEEADGDEDGSPLCADCDDADPTSYPGAPELCDNVDNDCDTVTDEFVSVCGLGDCTSTGYCSAGVDTCVPGPPSTEVCDGRDNDCDGAVPPVELDDDGDGLADCEGDCDDTNEYTLPGAIEVNDGDDNQCPGDRGFGLVDEITGQSGFTYPADPDAYCWPYQPFAIEYEASRSGAPDQPVDCVRSYTAGGCWNDPAEPLPGRVFFYLVRALCQYAGSLGADWAGVDRPWGCEHPDPGCPDGP